jgi:hypothetical protein
LISIERENQIDAVGTSVKTVRIALIYRRDPLHQLDSVYTVVELDAAVGPAAGGIGGKAAERYCWFAVHGLPRQILIPRFAMPDPAIREESKLPQR